MMMRAAVLTLLLTIPLAAQTVREEMLVSTDWLAANRAPVKLLYVGDQETYNGGHIEGAVLLDITSILTARDGIPNELPDLEKLTAVFRAAGIGNEGRIVLYSDESPFAERAWFTLDYLGHGHRAAILDGGLPKWIAENRPLSKEATVAKEAPFEAKLRPAIVAKLADLTDDKVLLDSRPRAQFEDPGHIPNAVNVPLGANFAADGTLKKPDELRAMYTAAGVTKDSTNITYCRSGMQASVTYFVLEYLGYDAALYDGSYAEWSKAAEKRE